MLQIVIYKKINFWEEYTPLDSKKIFLDSKSVFYSYHPIYGRKLDYGNNIHPCFQICALMADISGRNLQLQLGLGALQFLEWWRLSGKRWASWVLTFTHPSSKNILEVSQ